VNIAIGQIAINVGMSFENICLLLTSIGGLIFFAKDFRIGVIMQFIGSGLLFMLFYSMNGDYGSALILLFFWLTVLTLTIYFSAASKRQGAFI
jgi:hypothetical protein